ncbi:MAG TPA: ATP-binding protein [Candidatus Acidoferrales bacterium]|nr:ATP-binding protein [Candidatus Acidoferrales bacterium]
MRARLFWKLGLTYVALLIAVLVAVDFYSARVLQRDSIRAADDKLASLLQVAQARPPQLADRARLHSWIAWLSQSGARVTVIDSTGRVLDDSAHDPETMENHSNRPEIRQAFASGSGTSVRHSHTLNLDLVYSAIRYQPPAGPPVVIRLAFPQTQIDAPLRELRKRLLLASLAILILGGLASLGFSRMFAVRVERLKDFSRRIARGDFHSIDSERPRDELADLADALNETARHLDDTIRSLGSERTQSNAILRSMAEGVAVIDAQENLVFCNQAFLDILSVDSAAYQRRPVIEVVRNSELLSLIRRALQGQDGLRTDIATGIIQPRSFSVTAAPVRPIEPTASANSEGAGSSNANVRPSGAVVVLHDVTELRRLERVRQDFVANVSHEFKTPLTAIRGFAETLLSGALNDPQNNRRFLEIIRDHAARLDRLTDDLLKLARIEAGKLELEFAPVGIAELVESCAETTLLKASRKQIALEIDIPPALPALRGDASLLHEVLQNLLDNAVQYTPAGGRIHVCATATAREAVITVADTGIGIPLADQERIFERFYRVDPARSREAGGTGLGLSIARHIIDAHSGRLWVESEVGHGSKFYFSIPVQL